MLNNIVKNNILRIENTYKHRYCFEYVYNTLLYDDNAIALIGARRTGKTVLIEQVIYTLLRENKYSMEEIEYYTLPLSKNGTLNTDHLLSLVETRLKENNQLKVLAIDEISVITDFVKSGGIILNYCKANRIKLIISGTYSAIIEKSLKDTCLGRIKLINTTFISFKEYCYLREINAVNIEDKYNEINNFIENGFVLKKIDDKTEYINTTVTVNIALSILKSDEIMDLRDTDFTEQQQLKELTEVILKYFKYIGVSKSLKSYFDKLSSSDLTLPINSLRKKQLRDNKNVIPDLTATEKQLVMQNVINDLFKDFELSFEKCKTIEKSKELIQAIDSTLNSLNLIYSIIEIQNNSIEKYIDISLFQGYKYDFIKNIIKKSLKALGKYTTEDLRELNQAIKNIALGVLLEEIIDLEMLNLDLLEPDVILLDNLGINVNRKIATSLRKLRIRSKGIDKEVDLIYNDVKTHTLKLYEIKHSMEYNPHQHRWLEDTDIHKVLREYYKLDYTLQLNMLYLGESKNIQTQQRTWSLNTKTNTIENVFELEHSETPQSLTINYINIYDFLISQDTKNYNADTQWFYDGLS